MQRFYPSDPHHARRQLISVATIGLGLLLTLLITNILFNSFSQTFLIAILILGGLPVSMFAVLYWRWTFYLVFFLLVFEGVPRNLLNQVSLLLVKDVVLGLVYIGYFREYRFRTILNPKLRLLSFIILAILFYSLAEMLNPSLISPLVGLLGIKTLLFYIPLLYVGYEIIDESHKIIRFMAYMMILCNISCFFGIYQYIGGYEVIKAFQPVAVLSSAGALGQYYKMPGSFAGVGNFAGFLQIMFGLAFGLFYCRTKPLLKIFSIITMVNIGLVLVLMGQRSGWVFMLLCLFLGTFALSDNRKTRFVRVAVALFVFLSFLFVISSTDNIVGDRFSQFSSGDGFQKYLYDAPTGNIENQLGRLTTQGTIFGYGIGMAAPGSRYLNTNSEFIEAFTAVLIYELGFPGFILVTALLFMLVWVVSKALVEVVDFHYHNLIYFGLIVVIYIIIVGITYAPLNIPPNGQFFWLLPGMFIGLQRHQAETAPKAKLLKFEYLD